MWAMQTLNRSRSMSSETRASARWAALRGAALAACGLDLHLGGLGVTPVRLAIGLMHHHALGEEAGERLIEANMAAHLHGAGEEAAVEEMHHRVLDPADILIDREPAIDR